MQEREEQALAREPGARELAPVPEAPVQEQVQVQAVPVRAQGAPAQELAPAEQGARWPERSVAKEGRRADGGADTSADKNASAEWERVGFLEEEHVQSPEVERGSSPSLRPRQEG